MLGSQAPLAQSLSALQQQPLARSLTPATGFETHPVVWQDVACVGLAVGAAVGVTSPFVWRRRKFVVAVVMVVVVTSII